MGLDIVEIIMAVECEFKLDIPDAAAEKCDTVGKLVDYVHSNMQHNKNGPCPSQRGFYVVRRTLMEQLDLPRSAVKPETKLEVLIPHTNRRQIWNKLINALDPDSGYWRAMLTWPRRIRLIIFPIGPLMTVVALFSFPPIRSSIWILLFGAVLTMIIIALVTLPFKTVIPENYSTVYDLMKLVNTIDCAVWTKEDVIKRIKEIIAEVAGVAPEKITMESDWVRNLGIY